MAYGKVERLRTPAGTKAIVGLLLGASAADACAARGAARGGALVGSAAALGFATELAGIASGKPFGRYTYSSLLGRKVGGVPIAAASAWAMMARPAWVVAGLIAPRRPARVLVAAGALTAWDVFLDPRMAREGYWSWPGGGRYEGIPASNFAGWLATGAGVFCVWALIDGDDDPLHDGDGALALYVWTWVGELVANCFIWRRPRVALGGGLAMGAFAVPALLARARARRSP
jgi:putative membrane protein